MRTSFVTGAASGFGYALVCRLLEKGERVFATDVHVEGLRERLLARHPESGDRLKVHYLDLAGRHSIFEAVREALDWAPVDVLINNGGYAVFGSQGEADLEAIARMFSVNVTGLAAVTQALLPSLRERAGTIVQLSSVAGRMVFPESGFYAASKYAVEALSEGLFIENCTFGLRVVVVEPGSFDTGFIARANAESLPRSQASAYAALHETWDERKMMTLESPQPPSWVAEAIVRSLSEGPAFQRVRVGHDCERILSLRDALSVDAWVALSANQNGASLDVEGLLTPAEVLDNRGDEASLARTRLAYEAGFLGWWNDRELGKQALDRLS